MGFSEGFRYRVLVGLKGLLSHARSEVVAQTFLGSAGAKVEFANPDALSDLDVERELFVASWCAYPDLVPDEVIMAIPEPEEEHDGGPPLFLRPHNIIHTEVPALRYLVRIRLIEFQDWHTLPTSSDDEFYGDGDDDGDSDDSNHNGVHPGFKSGGGRRTRPRTTCFAGGGAPSLGWCNGQGFQPWVQARELRQAVRVGDFCVPCRVAARCCAQPHCCQHFSC